MCLKVVCIIVVLCCCFKNLKVKAYSKVYKSTTSNNGTNSSEDGPKIHRAHNMDLIFPNNPVEQTKFNEKEEETGRAAQQIDSFSFPFMNPNLRQPPPRIRQYSSEITRPSSQSYPVYRPQAPSRVEIDKMKGKGEAMDRYTPGEAVATSYYKGNNNNNKNKGYNYKSPPDKYSYNPPKDIYSFPPNSGANYSLSEKMPSKKTKTGVSSYLPPPAGPADSFGGFIGPVNPEYLPPYMKNPPPRNEMSKIVASSEVMDNDDTKNYMNENEANMQTPPPDSMESHDHDQPPMESHDHDQPPMESHDHDQPPMESHDHDHPPPNASEDQMISGPMPMDNMGSNNDDTSDHGHSSDHDHFHHDISWDSFPTFLSGHSYDMSPDVIYDDHHHHFHHPPEIMTTTTTERPEPRVKKYSYFYIGRKLWYIPLYFTVWFSFYILFLILKSIARHKVNLPNHYTGGSRKKRSINEMNHKEILERIDLLTVSTMAQIEAFKDKYL